MPITAKYILICDDVRREDNGKIIIVGMYIQDMIVPQLPFTMPTLAFFLNLESDRPGNFSFQFKLQHQESGTLIAQGMGMAPVNIPHAPIIMPVKIGNILFKQEGLYSFGIEFERETPIVASFAIRLGSNITPAGGAIMPSN